LTSLQGHEKQLGMLFHVLAEGHEGNINFPMQCTTEKQNITQIKKKCYCYLFIFRECVTDSTHFSIKQNGGRNPSLYSGNNGIKPQPAGRLDCLKCSSFTSFPPTKRNSRVGQALFRPYAFKFTIQ